LVVDVNLLSHSAGHSSDREQRLCTEEIWGYMTEQLEDNLGNHQDYKIQSIIMKKKRVISKNESRRETTQLRDVRI
jgi:hypothetical protein